MTRKKAAQILDISYHDIERVRLGRCRAEFGESPGYVWDAIQVAIAALREQDDRKVNKPLTMDELHKFIGRCVWWNGETCYCQNGYLVTDDGTFSFDWVLSHGNVYCRNPESKDSGRCNFCKEQWISVEERLPERTDARHQRDFYLVALSNGTVKTLAYEHDHYGNMLFEVGWHPTAYPVTHWMPLPEPPEVEV